jgi:serine/threonine-protein kinase RsbT
MAAELLTKTFTIYSGNFDKAGENSSEIKSILQSLHFNPDLIRRVVVVAFEAEMNVVMYANWGELTFAITEDEVKIDIKDEGQGIPDIEMAMQEGYSTASDEMREMGFGFGMGLPNIKKNSDSLNIESQVGIGTHVSARIRFNSNA